MKIYIDNIHLYPDETEDKINNILQEKFGLSSGTLFTVIKKSLDARKKADIHYTFRILIELEESAGEIFLSNYKDTLKVKEPEIYPVKKAVYLKVIIIGAGPAGIFSALKLVQSGAEVLLFERGKPVEERIPDIEQLNNRGILNPESNIVFGEGGAGTFSDGKLYTRSDRPENRWFYEMLVKFGADKKILYEAKPHLGTDKLRQILINIRKHLITSGAEIFFNEKISEFLISDNSVTGVRTSSGKEHTGDAVILATGHSARDVYQYLNSIDAVLEKKGFAVGTRIEHPAELINSIQYGDSKYKKILPAAEYALTYNNTKTERGTYTFCMCPGGTVINSSSESGMLCVNGMSNSARDSRFSNSAVVVAVKPDDISGDTLSSIEFQRKIEKAAYISGGKDYSSPAQRVTSFIKGKLDSNLPNNSFNPMTQPAELKSFLPDWICASIKDALNDFEKKMRGFISEEALFIGAETRTSSPVRILRGKDFQSVSYKNLFPAGEGAGYAGGIVSSAVDGIRIADAIIELKS